MKGIRSGAGRSRQQPWIGAPDPALTPNAGLAAVTELCGRLGVIGALDAAVGPIKQRERGFGAGELLAGLAAAQLAGEDFLTGLGPSPSIWTPPTWRYTAGKSAAWPITTRASGSAARTWPPGPRRRTYWPPTWATEPMTRGLDRKSVV